MSTTPAAASDLKVICYFRTMPNTRFNKYKPAICIDQTSSIPGKRSEFTLKRTRHSIKTEDLYRIPIIKFPIDNRCLKITVGSEEPSCTASLGRTQLKTHAVGLTAVNDNVRRPDCSDVVFEVQLLDLERGDQFKFSQFSDQELNVPGCSLL